MISLSEVLIEHKSKADYSDPIKLINIRHLSNDDLKPAATRIINQHLLFVYNNLLQKFPNSVRLRISFAFFLCYRLKYQNQSLQVLYQTLQADCKSVELYYLSKAKLMIETSISSKISTLPEENFKSILANSKVEEAFKMILSISSKIAKFWKNIVAQKSDLDITKRLSYEIMTEVKRLKTDMKVSLYQSYPPLLLAYYKFEKFMLYNQRMDESVLKTITDKSKAAIEAMFNFDNIGSETDLGQTDQGFAILETNDDKRYEVITCNKSFAKIINYQKDELLGTDFLVHVPKPMHNAARDLFNVEREFADRVFVLQMRHGYIREFLVSARRLTDDFDRDLIVLKLANKSQAYSAFLLLADKTGVITAYSTSN